MGRRKILLRCSTCGQDLQLTPETPDSALVELGEPDPLVLALKRLWRKWRGC